MTAVIGETASHRRIIEKLGGLLEMYPLILC